MFYVCLYATWSLTRLRGCAQEVKAATTAWALEEMAACEERHKHANSKAKKLKKWLQEVRCSGSHVRPAYHAG